MSRFVLCHGRFAVKYDSSKKKIWKLVRVNSITRLNSSRKCRYLSKAVHKLFCLKVQLCVDGLLLFYVDECAWLYQSHFQDLAQRGCSDLFELSLTKITSRGSSRKPEKTFYVVIDEKHASVNRALCWIACLYP